MVSSRTIKTVILLLAISVILITLGPWTILLVIALTFKYIKL